MNLTPVDIDAHRGIAYAATSRDRQWDYRQEPTGVWSVTHVPTGRRYWAPDLGAARADTWQGTAAQILDLSRPLPPGKPLARGEHTAIGGELSLLDQARMVAHVRAADRALVADAAHRVRFRGDRAAAGLRDILGITYGAAPGLWLDALLAVRPDLVPPHLDHQLAA